MSPLYFGADCPPLLNLFSYFRSDNRVNLDRSEYGNKIFIDFDAIFVPAHGYLQRTIDSFYMHNYLANIS